MAMGNSSSPVISDIFVEHFEEITLDTAGHKPTKWLTYVDDTFVVWPHGPAISSSSQQSQTNHQIHKGR
jgi:hypothetical protein